MGENSIRTGAKILIKRNDGRTHYAIISCINETTKYVAVEWFEDSETKGKEVDFETLFNLNPHLVKENIEDNKFKTENPLKRSLVTDWKESSGLSVPTRSQSAIDKTNYRVQRDDTSDVLIENTGKQVSRTLSSISLDKVSHSTENNYLVKREKNCIPIPKDTAEQDGSLGCGKPKKKSSTVKEVEKLQRNRAMRRIKQAEKKVERDALLTINSGNPNWQFQAMIKDYQNKLDFTPLNNTDEATDSFQIAVCVRKRPLNKKEILRKEVDVISVPRKNVVIVHEPKNKVDLTKYLENQMFKYDFTFDENCNNKTVYNFTAKPLVDTIFYGGLATCFAYGQTGSGKTHTMSGSNSEKGIYSMVALDVFECLTSPEHSNKNLSVSSSYYEIYGGKVYDLLAKKAKLRVLEDGKQQVQIVGLTEKRVKCLDEVLFLIDCGNNARTSGRTSANSSSSRSHAIFQITLRQGNSQKIYGRIHLIDLAGNERGADTSSASRITRLEGAEINKSLLALKECIRALGKKGSHLPFRGSVLTLVLRDSFIGDNTKTCMIAMISPGMNSCEHSLNTLRYANRVKELVSSDMLIETVDCKPKPGWHQKSESSETEEEVSISSDTQLQPEFHSVVEIKKSNKIQHLEQELTSIFQHWKQMCPKFDEKEAQLLLGINKLSYSKSYFSELEHALDERQKLLSALRDRVTAFKLQTGSEENLNNKENCKQQSSMRPR